MDGGASNFSSSFPDPQITAQDLEAGFSGGGATFTLYPSSSTNMRWRGSYRATVGSPPPTRSGAASAAAVFFCGGFSDEEPRHFLDSCFLCKSHLAGNHDIFMYRGDTPFCSEECRQQQIEMDEARENKWKRITSMKNREQLRKAGTATSPSDSHKIGVRAVAGTVVAG